MSTTPSNKPDRRKLAKQKPREQGELIPEDLHLERIGQLAGVDAIVFSKKGARRYVLTLVDLYCRFGFALGTHLHPSEAAEPFLQTVLQTFPATLEAVLIDNGSQFQGALDKPLKKGGIRHYAPNPAHPEMDAPIGRFNWTVRQEFADFEKELLFGDLQSFNEQLLEWLLFYNTDRPHQSLEDLSPMEFLNREQGSAPA